MRYARSLMLAFLLPALLWGVHPSAATSGQDFTQAVGHSYEGGASRARSFWTAERMRTAEPLALPDAPAEPEASSPLSAVASARTSPRLHPQTPPTEARTSSRSVASLGEGQAGGPIPYTTFEIADPSAFPYRTNGRLFGLGGDGQPYSCSATAVSSQNRSVVWTAAHCVYLEEAGGWSTAITFVPGYRDGNAPYGEWPAAEAWLSPGWVPLQNPSYDMAALVVAPSSDGMRLEDLVGGRGIAWNLARNLQFDSFGYPAVPSGGERLHVCESEYGLPDVFTTPPRTTAIGCGMTEGASGGGWIIRDQYLNGVNSYGFEELPEVMFGPYFGDVVAGIYGTASLSTAPGPLPAEPPPASLVGQNHPLRLSLRTVGDLTIRGVMSAPDGYAACTRGAPVGIFRIRGGDIRLLKVVSTRSNGAYAAKVRDVSGRYAAFSPEGYVDDLNVCTEVMSPAKRHRSKRR